VDKEQAGLIADTINGFVMRSELLRASLQISRFRIAAPSTGSSLQVLPADAASSWGLRPSLVVLDELSSWAGHGAEEFFQSLFSSLGKVKGARALVATTAHWNRHGLCWNLRSQVEQDPAWSFMRRGQCASWVSPTFLDEQRRLLPPHVFEMLHENQWTEAGGNFLTWAEVDAIFRDAIVEGSTSCFLGIDIGASNDRTAIAVVQAGGSPLNLRAIAIETAEGTPDERVQLTEVEARVVELARRFRPRTICLDPWQGLHLAERLRHRGLAVEEHAFTQASRARLYDDFLQLVRQRRLTSIENQDLRGELEGMRWIERLGLLRVDHQAGQHDDTVVALALACHAALSLESRVSGPITATRLGGPRLRPSMLQYTGDAWWT
jgi:phage terminase large subunit-like protein